MMYIDLDDDDDFVYREKGGVVASFHYMHSGGVSVSSNK